MIKRNGDKKCNRRAALFIIAERWKQPESPSTDEWIKEVWCIHTMEYYLAAERNVHVTTGMNLENCRVKAASHKRPYTI